MAMQSSAQVSAPTPTTVAAAVGGTSTAALAVVVLTWVMQAFKINMPPEVAVAIVGLVGAAAHNIAPMLGHWVTVPQTTPAVTVAPSSVIITPPQG